MHNTYLQVRSVSSKKRKKEAFNFRQKHFFDRLKIQFFLWGGAVSIPL